MSKKGETKSAIVLTGEQTEFARGQIDAFAKDYGKAKAGINNMSSHLLQLAIRAAKDGGAKKAEEVYKAFCRDAEVYYKQTHLKDGEEQPIKKLLPFWPVAKSQVLAGIKAGLDVSKYKTVYELVDATPKAERTPKTPEGEDADESGDDSTVTAPKGAHGDALTANLKRVHVILKAIVVQRPELVASAAVMLGELADELTEMAEIEDKAEKSGATPNVGGVPGESQANAA